MSLGSVMDAVLGVAEAQIPRVTTARAYRTFNEIEADGYPFAMAYARAGTRDRPIPFQPRATDEFLLVLVDLDDDAEQNVDTYRELIEDALKADPTVGGAAPLVYVSDFITAPEIDSQRASAALTITVERQQGESILIRWAVGVAVLLKDPASSPIGAYLGAMETALDLALGGTRLTNDIGDPLEAILEGTTRYQLSHVSREVPHQSNVLAHGVALELNVWRRQSSGQTERDYTEGGTMDAQMVTVIDNDFWKGGLSTVSIASEPELDFPSDLERI